MKEFAESLWLRAQDALRVARHDLPVSPDATASRAYYAAFYAVSASFARKGRTFRKHAAVEAAVHRDLVKSGAWPRELGAGYSRLVEARSTGDYGQNTHVSPDEAAEAIEIAADIMRAVSKSTPDTFPCPEGP